MQQQNFPFQGSRGDAYGSCNRAIKFKYEGLQIFVLIRNYTIKINFII